MSPDRQDDYITRGEMQEFKSDLKEHLRELANSQTQVLDERLKALTWRGLLALGVAVGLLRFDVPDEVTAVAVVGAIVASFGKALFVMIGGKL